MNCRCNQVDAILGDDAVYRHRHLLAGMHGLRFGGRL
jgi:hypothetical protein